MLRDQGFSPVSGRNDAGEGKGVTDQHSDGEPHAARQHAHLARSDRIGTNGDPVTHHGPGVTYRHPGLLIKTVTTLDVLSGGRAWLGIGAAWNEQEHRGLGVPYPGTAERFERLEETLQLAHQMWSGDDSPFEGEHYRLERPRNSPTSLSKPHPPILIGGGGEKKRLRMVAQYADACDIFDMGPDGVKAKYDVIRGHCETLGRDYAGIEKAVHTGFVARC